MKINKNLVKGMSLGVLLANPPVNSSATGAPVIGDVPTEEEIREEVTKAEESQSITDIESAREMVNGMEEGPVKVELQGKLDAIFPGISLVRKNATGNVDIYIKSENSLHMALSTNKITFEDYSGVDEIEMDDAVQISINSSLPYELNAYLVEEIQNSDKSETIDKDRLGIRDNTHPSDEEYKKFTTVGDKLILQDNCPTGNDKEHTIDLMLEGGEAYPADVYKTVIKFEAQQK